MFSRHIVVLYNHTKIHTIIFHLILVLKVLTGLVFSFSSFSNFHNRFLEKKLLYDNLVLILNSFLFFLFWQAEYQIICFLIFSTLFIRLTNSFSKDFIAFFLRFVFFSLYDFNLLKRLLFKFNNCMYFLKTLFMTNACFNFVMCIAYWALSWKLT